MKFEEFQAGIYKQQYVATNQLLNDMVEADILEEVIGWERNRVFYFRRYMQIFNAKHNI